MKNIKKVPFLPIKAINVIYLLIIMVVISAGCKEQRSYQGYKLIEKRFVREVNAECYFLEHMKSGAQIIKIAAKDPNKTFCIAFKTIPESDNGAPHILEHSVLNGSKNFPVKSPFDVLSKGSLNTFMNAFTSKDFTMFPVASMNDKDYFNLIHVYLDAVFNPMFRTDDRILKQEGWHYELEDKDGPVVYKGVVYNEMKGAFSSPNRELAYLTYKNLFPDNGYGYESGGYPPAIPSLTQEAFKKYYERYYHPDNSYIFLYGDADLGKELDFIDKEYLSKYQKNNQKATIEDQKPFIAMKDITGYYPVMEGAPTQDQTYLSLNWVAGKCTDRELTMSLDILCEVLVNQESAPVRLALQKAGIGQDVSASTDNFKQNVVRIIVQNANAKDKDRFLQIVKETLQDEARKGIDRKEIEGVLNRLEFQLREGNDAQKGMTAVFQSQPGFFFANDPFMGMEYEKPLADLKKAIDTKSLEATIRKYLLNNPHALLLTLEPKPGLDKERNDETTKELKEYKAKLDLNAVASLVKETQDLILYQKREDTPAALATIPMLDLKDIEPKATWYPIEEKKVDGVPVLLYDQFSNDVVYVNFFFDLRVLPEKMIPYASLLSNVIGLLSTEKYPYGELNQQLNIHTGGFYTNLNSFLEHQDDNTMLPKFQVTTKALNNKLDKLFELSAEILTKTNYTDTSRLKTILTRHQSQLEASIKNRGNKYASMRLSSYFNNQGMFNELTSGLDYYWFITDLVRNFDKDPNVVTTNLKNVAALLFTKENLVNSVTCSKKDMDAFTDGFASLIKSLPAGTKSSQEWSFNLSKLNEGIQTASKVQYVIEGYNFKKLGYKWDGKMRVLDQILSTDWLQSRIRVIGGAYGGYSSISPTGFISFNSYRDPNLKETLENYQGTVNYLTKFNADAKEMTRYIIGTIASLDQPMTNSQKGDLAVNLYFSKRTQDDLQRDRNSVLSTKPEDIRGYSKMIQDVLSQNAFCVYGNEAKIKSEKNLFSNLIRIEK
jgi:presequence protease